MKRTSAVVMVALMMLAMPVFASETITLKFATVEPLQAPPCQSFKLWSEKVMRDSEGTLKIEIYAGGTLGRNPALQLKSLMDGVVDMAWMVGDYTPGRFPDDHVCNLPFMAENQVEGGLAAQRLFEKGRLRGYEDIVVLTLGSTEPYYINTTFPVRKPEDLKGLKFRVAGKLQADMLLQLGVTPVGGITITQAAEAMARGVVDGTICDTNGLFAFRIGDVAKHHYKLPLGTVTLLYAMNKSVYESLPPRGKAAIDKNRGETLNRMLYEPLHKLNGELLAKLDKDPAHTVIIPSQEEVKIWKAAIQPIIEDWKKNAANGEKLLSAYQEELEKIRAGK